MIKIMAEESFFSINVKVLDIISALTRKKHVCLNAPVSLQLLMQCTKPKEFFIYIWTTNKARLFFLFFSKVVKKALLYLSDHM